MITNAANMLISTTVKSCAFTGTSANVGSAASLAATTTGREIGNYRSWKWITLSR